MGERTTRRSYLRTCAAASALLPATGVASARGNGARARQGGSGILRRGYLRHDERFRIVAKSNVVTRRCRGRPKVWRCYVIQYESDGRQVRLLVTPNRRLDLDDEDEWHEFTAARPLECRTNEQTVSEYNPTPYYKVSFKPATDGGPGNGRRTGNGGGNGTGRGKGNGR